MRLAALPLAFLLAAPGIFAQSPEPLPAKGAPQAASPYDRLLAPYFPSDGPGASVLVVKDGKTLYANGYGLANVELRVPSTTGFVYRIGSVTKQFTAAAVLSLVEEGKVELDAPLSRYLEGMPETWRPLTVQQLLTHTSGVPSYTELPEFRAHMREDLPGRKLLETLVWTKPLDFAPGAKWHYSNTGYHLLGLLVEKVSGRTYADYLQSRFFGPLGLTRTRYGTETELIAGMASGYSNGKPAPYLSMTQPYAAGSLVSCVEDLAHWTLALHAGKVLKPESVKRMTTPVKTADGKEDPYGFGLGFRESQGHRLVGHGGGINGFACILEADPAARTVAVILCNSDDPKAPLEYLSRRLLAIAAGSPIVDPTGVDVAPGKLARLAGSYQHEGFRRTIAFARGHLTSQAAGGPIFELIPMSELTFQLKGADTMLRFEASGEHVLGVHRQNLGEAEEPLAPKVPTIP